MTKILVDDRTDRPRLTKPCNWCSTTMELPRPGETTYCPKCGLSRTALAPSRKPS